GSASEQPPRLARTGEVPAYGARNRQRGRPPRLSAAPGPMTGPERARGEAGRGLRARWDDPRSPLEARPGRLPPPGIRRIEAAEDPERLRAAIRQTLHLSSLDELPL